MSEIEQLRAELARLQGRLDELEQVQMDQPVPRRHMLRALGGVAAGAAVGGLAFAKPTSAADGNNIIIGDANIASSGTELGADGSFTQGGSGGIFGVTDNPFGAHKIFNDEDGLGASYGTDSVLPALQDSAISGVSSDTSTAKGVTGAGVTGVQGFGTTTGVSGTGVSYGGLFESPAGIGLGAQGTTGLIAIGDGANSLGAKLSGETPLKLAGSTAPDPASGVGGLFKFHSNTLYFSTGGLNNPQWRRLASTDSAGVFVPVTPFRVFDSRKSGSPLTSGSDVTIDCSDARDADTGAVTVADALPAGATAIAFNVTVVGTSSRGFLSVNPGGTASASASTINWGADNDAAIANGSIVSVDANRQIKIFCGGPAGNSTDFIIDIVGYYH
jgi:hypothetical protein